MNIEITRDSSLIQLAKIYNSRKRVYTIIKRIIDILFALIGCIILIPLTFCIWIANKLSKDKGPIFYTQQRIGKNGKTFKIYKFRSMVVDADEKLKEYLLNNPEMNEEFNKYRKLKDDPRITKVGKIIRKTCLDEFPQFVNVLKGNLSIVGPRPIIEEELVQYGNDRGKFLSVMPGLTGFWAANRKIDTSYAERMKMELYYVDNASIMLDIQILFKTIVSIIKRDGVF